MRPIFVLSVLPLAVLLLAGPVAAATFVVDSTEDSSDAAPGNAICADAEGACTLRAAVQEANANGGADRIEVPEGVFQLKQTGADEDAAATGDLDLTDDVTVVGAGAALSVVAGKKDRVFHIASGVTATITDLTVTKGKLGDKKRFQQGESFDGGGIFNEGELTLERAIITKNKSIDDGGGIGGDEATLVMTDVLISNNKAGDDGGGVDHDDGELTATNVTFAKNKARDEGGGIEVDGGDFAGTNLTFSQNKASEGGGMNIEEFAAVTLQNVTFYKNKARDESGGLREESGDLVEVTNTLFDGNKKGNCSGDITSNGGNLEAGGDTCGLDQPSDQTGVADAGVGKLDDNGGPTPTHAIDPDSPAVDGGVALGCPATDQRGEPRDDGTCDVGAFEL